MTISPDPIAPAQVLNDGGISPVVLPISDYASEKNTETETVRVLHVINGEHFSGAERVQDLLAQCLPESGYEVGFACVKPDKFDDARESDAPIFDVQMNSRFDLTAIRKLRQIVLDGDYKILHAHTPRSLMLASIVARWLKLPLVYHVHSPTSRDSTNKIRSFVNAAVETFSMGNAKRIVTVSNSLRKHIQCLGFEFEQISVVPNGVSVSDVRRSPEPPTGTWTIGTVALFRGRKGTEVLLDAISELRSAGRDVCLRAVGPFETPEYEKQIMDQVERLGIGDAIDWVGFTKDVHSEFKQMDLFVLPSLFGEGLPMVVLEAMACGVPPIGTTVEGVPEAIKDRHNGLLAKPNDAKDLARVIALALDGEVSWSELRENAIARHAEEFSDQSMASGVAAVYDEILKESNE